MRGVGPALRMTAQRSGPLHGSALAPGDRIISHLALVLGGMSVGETWIEGLLESEDVLAAADAMLAFGAKVERRGPSVWSIYGVGVGGFLEADDVIYCGGSARAAAHLMGAVATSSSATLFTGDDRLRGCSVADVIEALTLFGASFQGRSQHRLPLVLKGATAPMAVEYRCGDAPSYVKAAAMLAGLNAPGQTQIVERRGSPDHVERLLTLFGVEVVAEEEGVEERRVRLTGQPEMKAQSITVARDPGCAAYPLVAAVLCEGSEVSAGRLCVNPARRAFFETLQRMGGDVSYQNEREESGEPIADLRARSSQLKGVEATAEQTRAMQDEIAILAVCASFAEGETTLRGVDGLDGEAAERLDLTVAGLRSCGVAVERFGGDCIIHGCGSAGVGGAPPRLVGV